MHHWASLTLKHMWWGVRWDGHLSYDLTAFVFVCSCVCWREREERVLLFDWKIYILCTYVNLKPYLTSFPVCAHRSCTTSKAWKCRETWRGSSSRSCSQTQTILLCWQAGATLLEVCSSRFPSAPLLTWSTPSPAHISLRVAKWGSTCLRSRQRHVSGQYWETWGSTHRLALTLGINPPMDDELAWRDNAWFVFDSWSLQYPSFPSVISKVFYEAPSGYLWKIIKRDLLFKLLLISIKSLISQKPHCSTKNMEIFRSGNTIFIYKYEQTSSSN